MRWSARFIRRVAATHRDRFPGRTAKTSALERVTSSIPRKAEPPPQSGPRSKETRPPKNGIRAKALPECCGRYRMQTRSDDAPYVEAPRRAADDANLMHDPALTWRMTTTFGGLLSGLAAAAFSMNRMPGRARLSEKDKADLRKIRDRAPPTLAASAPRSKPPNSACAAATRLRRFPARNDREGACRTTRRDRGGCRSPGWSLSISGRFFRGRTRRCCSRRAGRM